MSLKKSVATESKTRNIAGRKTVDVNTKRGKASNGQGIRYGARQAGRGSEHFEGGRFGATHTHGSRKVMDANQRSSRKRDKGREQRITSG